MKQQREDYTTTDPRGDEGQEQPNDIRRLMLLSKVREYGRFDAAVRLVGLEVAAQMSVCITRTCSLVQAAGRTHTCSRTGPLLPARRGTGRCERGQHGSPATEKVHADDADADAQRAAAGSKNLRQRRATLPSIEADRRANLRFPPIPSQVDRQYQLMLPSSENRFFGNRNGDCAPKTTSCALRASRVACFATDERGTRNERMPGSGTGGTSETISSKKKSGTLWVRSLRVRSSLCPLFDVGLHPRLRVYAYLEIVGRYMCSRV
jgi:hypothetical protein